MRLAMAVTIVLATLLAPTSAVEPRRRSLCRGILPENDLRIPVGSPFARGITEVEFNSILDAVERVYAPIVAAQGAKLVMNRDWKDDTVNAYASREGKEWHVSMLGGLARHEAITGHGFALVACHEVGHHLGGFPKKEMPDIDEADKYLSWATNEGGSDYYANLKCLRRVLPVLKNAAVDPTAARACAGAYGADAAARAACETSAMAGLSLATLMQRIASEANPPKFDAPDPRIVDKMNDAHPPAQCRLDTYFQGALCSKPLTEEVSDVDAAAGACTAKGRSRSGLRPRCWYKPPADEPEGPRFSGDAIRSSRVRVGSFVETLGL
ncbi:MAG: hypothetical protein HY078_12330 [Elusimicrobia bacterium]|nr:hypothetical protein [Elusimicrobiota bacterium]